MAIMNIKQALEDWIEQQDDNFSGELQFSDVTLDTEKIGAVLINEVPPADPADGFYSTAAEPAYMSTVLPLFQQAGIPVASIQDILNRGIYITTAVKLPKTGYDVPTDLIKAHIPLLEAELALFPNKKVVMLMGDVAKKAYNMIVKKETRKNVIPAGSTYKIRQEEFYHGTLRVFPSYIMTGGNILIEKSKRQMIQEDLARMITLL